MKKLLTLALLTFATSCLGDWTFINNGTCSFNWGRWYYGNLYDPNTGNCCNCAAQSWSCCNGPMDPGNSVTLPSGRICPATGVSIAILDGHGGYAAVSPIYWVNTYGPDSTLTYNCYEFGGTTPGVLDEDDLEHLLGPGQDDDPCVKGSPVYEISEPWVAVHLRDEPLGYTPALGPRVSFSLRYGQHEQSAGYDPNIFSVGKKWSCSWLAYVTQASATTYRVHFAGGGSRVYGASVDYLTNARLTGDTSSGFVLSYPDGSTETYGFIVANSYGSFLKAFLTQRQNPQGQAIRFYYANYDPAAPVVRLLGVVDGDGRATTISYVPANGFSTNLISQVTDPFGRSATMLYDPLGRLTNIVDVVQLPSSFLYNPADSVTNMATQYGQTSFKLTESTGAALIPNGRSVEVTEPDGAKQLYLFTNGAPGLANSYSSEQVPVIYYFGTALDNNYMATNNSFHWNKRQYAAL
jgi:hypothetical protein